MNNRFLFFVVALVTQSCVQQTDNKALLQKIDSLQQDIRALKQATVSHQGVDSTKAIAIAPTNDEKPIAKVDTKEVVKTTDTTANQERKPEPEKIIHQPVHRESNDTIFKFYVDKKLSVKITPWVDGARMYFLYDRQGNQSFSMEEIRRSYSVGIDLKYYDNGAVSMAEIHTNPGASMYWYESTITFSNNNEPVAKTDQRMPIRNLDDAAKKYFWNSVDKRWVEYEQGYKPLMEQN